MPALTTPDRRMFQAIELLKQNGTIRYTTEFCEAIGIHKQNIRNIKEGRQHFTVEQIRETCKKYGFNANWILGLSRETFTQHEKSKVSAKG